MDNPDTFEAFTVVLLAHEDHFLLLRRNEDKEFAPGLWTGIGGRVEAEEFSMLATAALRELKEESGIGVEEVTDFTLRRVLLLTRQGRLIMLLYFTGRLNQRSLPPCPEGTLVWLQAEDLAGLDIIPSTRPVLPMLIADQASDAEGREPVRLGIGHYQPDGSFDGIVWA